MSDLIFSNGRIEYNMPSEEYHTYDALSNSGMKEFDKSPYHYQYYKANSGNSTDALSFGRLYHMAILEPDLFASGIVYNPHKGTTKAGIAFKEAQFSNGKQVISGSSYEQILNMQNTLMSTDTAKRYLMHRTMQKEVSVFWTITFGGVDVPCKARFDAVSFENRLICDLKTTARGGEAGFIKDCYSYNYARQDAWYRTAFKAVTGEEARGFVFFFQEKDAPYQATFHTLDDETRKYARLMNEASVCRFAECIRTGGWHGYPDVITEVSLNNR